LSSSVDAPIMPDFIWDLVEKRKTKVFSNLSPNGGQIGTFLSNMEF
jgi:hypothetical protein